MRSSRVDQAFARYRAKGDPRALARVFDATAPELFRLAWHLCGDRHTAEDLVQVTFLAAMEDAQSFDPGCRVMPWLCGILANRARMARRGVELRPTTTEQRTGMESPDPADAAAARELQGTVQQELRALSEPYREVLILHLEHGLSGKEIADVLHRPAATVRSQIMRGLEMLRHALPADLDRSSASLVPAVALDRVRAVVLASAEPLASPFVGTVGGLVAMKKLIAVAAAVVLALFAARHWPDEVRPTSPEARSSRSTVTASALDPETTLPPPKGSTVRDEVAVAEAPTTGGINVAVRWAEDGSPARDIGVLWQPERDAGVLFERAGRTDSEGLLHLGGLAPGACVISTDRGTRVDVEVRIGAPQLVAIEIPAGVNVHGRVVDMEDRPIGGAHVWLSSGGYPGGRGDTVATTVEDGTFAVPAVQSGRMISAWADGFGPAQIAHVPGDDVRHAFEITLKLPSVTGALRGRVLQPNGEPVENAVVLVGGAGDAIAVMRKGKPSRFVRTDASGWFQAVWLRPGQQHLWARAPGFAPRHEAVEVSESGVTSVEIWLLRGATVSGMIVDVSGEPAEGVRVRALHEDIEPWAGHMRQDPVWARVETTTDAEGRYELSCLMPGRMKLRAERDGTRVTTAFTLIDEEQQMWNARLGSGTSIRGVVTSAHGEPLPDWKVWAQPSERQKGLPMTRTERTDALGRFELTGAEEGVYDVVVRAGETGMHPAEWMLHGVRPGPEILVITVPIERIPSVRFEGSVLSPEGASLTDLRLSLQRAGEDGTLEGASGTQRIERGRFTSSLVLPGRYYLTVNVEGLGRLQLGAWEARAFETVDVGEHQYRASGQLVVELVDPHGERLPEGRIVMRGPGASQGILVRMENGLAHVEDLQPGRYVVSTWGSQITSISRHVDVVAGRVTELRFEVPDGVQVTLLMPPVARDRYQMRQVWRDEAGEMVFEGSGGWDRSETPVRWGRFVPPGRYSVEISDASGASETIEVIASEATRDVVIELPVLTH